MGLGMRRISRKNMYSSFLNSRATWDVVHLHLLFLGSPVTSSLLIRHAVSSPWPFSILLGISTEHLLFVHSLQGFVLVCLPLQGLSLLNLFCWVLCFSLFSPCSCAWGSPLGGILFCA
jgi:hypothetical protein